MTVNQVAAKSLEMHETFHVSRSRFHQSAEGWWLDAQAVPRCQKRQTCIEMSEVEDETKAFWSDRILHKVQAGKVISSAEQLLRLC